jgi:hypothetical protein
MKFDVYGRFTLEVIQEGESWVAYRAELGKRRRENTLVFPPGLEATEIATFLDDVYHEFAAPGQCVQTIS